MELITKQHLIRQWELVPADKLGTPVTIIGAGAIGSFVALQLAKMGFEDISVWDHDTVSIENMSNQFYRFKDIGKPKVIALSDLVHDFTGETLAQVMPKKWEPNPSITKGIVILAVDCMQARKDIFLEIQNSHFFVDWVIDARMSAQHAAVYVMNPHNKKDQGTYAKTLYSNENAEQERCTAKSTMYTVNILSGLVCKAVKNLISEEMYARITQYNIADNAMVAHTSVDLAPMPLVADAEALAQSAIDEEYVNNEGYF